MSLIIPIVSAVLVGGTALFIGARLHRKGWFHPQAKEAFRELSAQAAIDLQILHRRRREVVSIQREIARLRKNKKRHSHLQYQLQHNINCVLEIENRLRRMGLSIIVEGVA